MFETSNRRHPVQTIQFWGVVLTCFVVVTAWKLDLFTPSRSQLMVVNDEPMPPPPPGGQSEIPEAGQPETAVVSTADSQTLRIELGAVKRLPALARGSTENEADNAPVADGLPPQQEPRESSTRGQIIQTAALTPQDSPTTVMRAVAESEAPQSSVPTPSASDAAINFDEVDRLIQADDDVGALRLLSQRYWKSPETRPQLQERLDVLSRRIYFSPHVHYLSPYAVQFGDRPETVARKYRITREYLTKLNRLESASIRAGQTLKVIEGPFSAVIDASDYVLTIHAQGYYVAQFKLGFGVDSSIPEGKFQVTDKVTNPDYYGPSGVISHSDPVNPLGSRWIAINDANRSLQGYGLHGCLEYNQLGACTGAGCVRLSHRDAEAVFDLLTIGSEVIIHP